MNKSVPVVICKVNNGFKIIPAEVSASRDSRDEFVFQEKGGAISKSETPTEKTLLGFLNEHFQDDSE